LEIPFAPDLVIGTVRVAWHSIFSFLGALVALVVAVRLARPFVRDERVHLYAVAVLVGGLITARLGHVADNWANFADDPLRIVTFAGGGIAVTAAPIGSTIAGILAARRLGLPVGLMLDIAAIGIVVGLAVGRIGDVINGEHHAVACSGLAWCVRYTHPETLGQTTFVHPVVAYDGLLDLVIAAVAYAYWRRIRGRPPEGRAYLLVLGVYGIGRFLSSFLRLDPVVLAGLQAAQVLGLAYALIAFPLLLWASGKSSPRRADRGPQTEVEHLDAREG
jgi:phosphatidylglycerol:prolipoprotein diacylglycerol transferase